jgi:putative CocE/NonD family hydrolase
MKSKPFLIILLFLAFTAKSQSNNDTTFVKDNYSKMDTTISMRDGIKLYTVIYIPKDQSVEYPFLMERTPFSAEPYGAGNFPKRLGNNRELYKEKYIFVYQDVRGRYMSEGHHVDVTPYIANKKSTKDVDESSDAYDTIEWLLKNIKNNNGRVGIYGVSYAGFYATASLPGAHPAIKAVSPQAPVTDFFMGDDAFHNGAFFLMDNFDFMVSYGESNGPVKDYGGLLFDINRTDAYTYFLNLGPLKNTQSEKYFNHRSYLWDGYLAHDTYDEFWKARNIRQHLKNITIPTLVVGGWFDSENLFGALRTYEAIETQSPGNKNRLVIGPWTHGVWFMPNWTKFGTYDFKSNTNQYFQDSLDTKFFNFYLKDKGEFNAAEATVFETGSNQWKNYTTWPPENVTQTNYYFNANKKLSLTKSNKETTNSFTEYISDPKNPVPYISGVYRGRYREFIVEDQRFAEARADVIAFVTEPVDNDITVSGRILADLFISTTGTDADFIVKLIDVLPDNEVTPKGPITAGFQRLVRAEVMRGKFRNSYEKPEPFTPGKVSEVKFGLNDINHTFKKGHKIMVQVQSTWFPLVDINPQKFMRIPEADEKDFQKAMIRIYHDGINNSKIVLPVLK